MTGRSAKDAGRRRRRRLAVVGGLSAVLLGLQCCAPPDWHDDEGHDVRYTTLEGCVFHPALLAVPYGRTFKLRIDAADVTSRVVSLRSPENILSGQAIRSQDRSFSPVLSRGLRRESVHVAPLFPGRHEVVGSCSSGEAILLLDAKEGPEP